MEPCRVAEERDWDFRRLQHIRPSTERTVYGTIIDPLLSLVTSTYHSNAGIGYTRQVVAAMSPRILHCKCVRQLMPHLARRQVVAASVSTYILSQVDSEAAGSLEKLLNGRSREPANVASMVEGIYLALLDCYEESGNVWLMVWLSADLDLLVCIYPYLALLPIFTTSLQCEGSYSCWI